MKKYRLLFLLLCLMLLAACAKETPAPTAPPVTTTAPPVSTTATPTTVPPATTEAETTVPVPQIEVNEVHKSYIQQGTGTVLANISLSVPRETGLQNADAYYEQWLDDMTFYIEQDLVDLEAFLADEDSGPFYGPYEYDASFQVGRNDGVLLSFVRDFYTFTGGAHGGTGYWSETYIVESGVLLSASDLFAMPFDEAMDQVCLRVVGIMSDEALGDLYDAENPEASLKEGWDSRDFYFTETGIVFLWQEYAIAPYAAGPQIFELPYADVADILNPRWLP